jgi:hypothetical protein
VTGIEMIAAERERQVSDEGWTPEHDDTHARAELLAAAVAYAVNAEVAINGHDAWPTAQDVGWPWDEASWKPRSDDPVRDLVKAGALIAAEIDRIQRRRERRYRVEKQRVKERSRSLREVHRSAKGASQ